MLRPFLVLILGLASASSTQWVKLDTPGELKCTIPAGDEINSCKWKTPTMDSARWKINDNIGYNITHTEKECIVQIENIQEKDEGTWECDILFHNDDGTDGKYNETKTVNIAKFPKEGPTIDVGQSGDNDTETVYTCIYESTPSANFTWYLDDAEIPSEGATVTLQNDEYTNGTLKCTVDFEEHGLPDTFSATTSIGNGGSEQPDDGSDEMESTTTTSIVIVAVVVGLSLLIMVLWLCGCLKNPSERKPDDTDAETGTSDSLPMKESTGTEKSDDETEKADSTKDEKEKLTEAVKGTFGDRLASFFRINKSFNMDDEKIDESEKKTDDDELQKVVIDNAGGDKEENGDMDKTDSKTVLTEVSLETEKAESNGHDQTEEPIGAKSKKANGGNKLIAVFTKMFKPRSDAVADKSIPDEENLVKTSDEEPEQNKVEETAPLTDELEPEDKAEPVEEEDNKKEPTPNTSF
jgi:hypothetical protein